MRQGGKTELVLGPAGACRTPLSHLRYDAWDLHPTGPPRFCARRTCNIFCRKRCMASAEIETGALVLPVIRCLSLNVVAKKYFVSLRDHDASTARQLRPDLVPYRTGAAASRSKIALVRLRQCYGKSLIPRRLLLSRYFPRSLFVIGRRSDWLRDLVAPFSHDSRGPTFAKSLAPRPAASCGHPTTGCVLALLRSCANEPITRLWFGDATRHLLVLPASK